MYSTLYIQKKQMKNILSLALHLKQSHNKKYPLPFFNADGLWPSQLNQAAKIGSFQKFFAVIIKLFN